MANEVRQFIDKDGVAHLVDFNFLANKPDIPSKTSDLTNDVPFVTKSQYDELVSRIDDLIADLRAAGIPIRDGSTAIMSGTMLDLVGAYMDGDALVVGSGSVSNESLTL